MSEIPEIPIEEVKESAVKFDLCNLTLEIEGLLENLKGDSEALDELHKLLSDALAKCSQAIGELESSSSSTNKQRIPDD